MELRLYTRIVLKRLWIVVLLVAIVLAASLVGRTVRPTAYHAQMRFVVGIEPEPAGDYYAFDRYYTWLTAEYLVDDLAEVVKSRAFAGEVAALAGLPMPPGAIQGATGAGKTHRVLNVGITWGNEAELGSLANATVELLTQRAGDFFAQLSTEAAVVLLIDPPQVFALGPSLRERLDLPLRLLLALAAGLVLTFVLDYMDDAVRHRDDLAALGLPILAEIPTRHRWRWLWPLGRRSP